MVLASGIRPRTLEIEGSDHPKVLSYVDVIVDKKPVGDKVAIIGAGGIGFDVAEYLVHQGTSATWSQSISYAGPLPADAAAGASPMASAVAAARPMDRCTLMMIPFGVPQVSRNNATNPEQI